ncbi:hypothetical protein D3C75_1130370 [compost metagenome]
MVGGGKVAEFLGQPLRFDHRFRVFSLDGWHDLRQRRFTVWPAAEQIDKRIFKARFRFAQFSIRQIQCLQ